MISCVPCTVAQGGHILNRFVFLFTVLPQAAAPCVETAGQERRTETEVEMFPTNKIIYDLNGSFISGGSYLFRGLLRPGRL